MVKVSLAAALGICSGKEGLGGTQDSLEEVGCRLEELNVTLWARGILVKVAS